MILVENFTSLSLSLIPCSLTKAYHKGMVITEASLTLLMPALPLSTLKSSLTNPVSSTDHWTIDSFHCGLPLTAYSSIMSAYPLHKVILILSCYISKPSLSTKLHPFNHLFSHTYIASLLSPSHINKTHAPPIQPVSTFHIHVCCAMYHGCVRCICQTW